MTLRLWKLRLDARAVAAFARAQRLSHRESDDGYVAHAALTAAFRGTGPQPFALERMLSPEPSLDPATDTVLGYSSDDFDRAHLAPEHAHLVIDGESKPVPAVPVGAHVAFLTRVAPTVRTHDLRHRARRFFRVARVARSTPSSHAAQKSVPTSRSTAPRCIATGWSVS